MRRLRGRMHWARASRNDTTSRRQTGPVIGEEFDA
jgi:hypothetical protein